MSDKTEQMREQLQDFLDRSEWIKSLENQFPPVIGGDHKLRRFIYKVRQSAFLAGWRKNDRLDEIDESTLEAESMLGHDSEKGLVRLSYGITFELMLDPQNAREFAYSILEAAEAAETDEFIYKFLGSKIGLTDADKRIAFLRDFRLEREKFRRSHSEQEDK